MKKNVKVQTCNVTHITSISTKKKGNYGPTVYYYIENEGMKKYFRCMGIKIVTIPHDGKKCMYALIPCESQKKANELNRALYTMKKQSERAVAKQKLHEISLDELTETGYDLTKDVINTTPKLENIAEELFNKE